ncbi:MAG: DNA replication/repair protein RecF [Gammaproteobacteria bacterium]|nr:DNA replication/repair protein RecF [Gammaproteobacteria bacterium]
MSLVHIEISHFRNLQQVSLQPAAKLNIITGENAAGKTNLLESLHYLSFARSFRTAQTRDLIMYQQPFFRLIGKLQHPSATLGIQKSSQEQIIRINQQTVNRSADLAAMFPVVAIHPDSHQLISAGPEYRRQYLDWGVFHVEHHYLQVWKDFRTALSQRNAALRHNQPDTLCCLWDQALVEAAQRMEIMRLDYLEKLALSLDKIRPLLFPEAELALEYRPGWQSEAGYQAYLAASLYKDKEKGFTQGGPHRADLRIKLDNKPVQSAISRGQQKKLVAMLKLAQMDVFSQHSDKTCVLLYDDLPAELDTVNRNKLLKLLSKLPVQVFISAIEANQLDLSGWSDMKMFHVKHGEVDALD